MDAGTLAFVVVVVLLTGAVQALAGFGFALVAVPILVLRLEVHDAVVLSTLTGTTANLIQSWQLRGDADRDLTRRFVAATLLGAPVGLSLFALADPRVLRLLVGVGVLVGVVLLARRAEPRGPSARSEWVSGTLSGVLLTSTSMNGPPLVLELQSRGVAPAVFRATLNATFFVGGVIALGLFAGVGEIGSDSLLRWAVALPTLFGGLALGNYVRRFVSVEGFRRIVFALLVVSGASSVFAAVLG